MIDDQHLTVITSLLKVYGYVIPYSFANKKIL